MNAVFEEDIRIKRSQPGRLITIFIIVLMIVLVVMISSAEEIGLIIAKVTSAPASCKMGESIKVKYSTLGLEYDSVTGFLQFYAVPKKDTMDPCILLHEVEVTADSSGEYSYTVDESAGEWLRICLARNDPYVVSGKSFSFYVHITDGKPRKEFSESTLGTSGWVTKNGKKYYGDKDGNAVIGKKTIDGKEYFFNHLGELMYGWFRDDDLFWIYSDENGILRSGHMEGIQEFYIPSYVDRMKISNLAGAGRQFYIKCEPGSYAESFALEKGIQYDNGVKRVIGLH